MAQLAIGGAFDLQLDGDWRSRGASSVDLIDSRMQQEDGELQYDKVGDQQVGIEVAHAEPLTVVGRQAREEVLRRVRESQQS